MRKEHKDIFFSRYACPPSPKVKKYILVFLTSGIFFLPTKVFASVAGEVNKANALYRQGKFDDSLGLYQRALEQDDKSAVVKYDLGTTLYKKGKYSEALGYLEQATADKNIDIKSKAEYNLGNTLYKAGMQKAGTHVDQAIKSLQEALGHYGQTITVYPKDQDALFNQDFVKKEIERLKKIKQRQRQGQQGQQKQQSQQNQQKNQEKKQSSVASGDLPRRPSEASVGTQEQAEENQKELNRKQAEDLLENYQENEEPKKLLNYMPKKIDERPVLKDW